MLRTFGPLAVYKFLLNHCPRLLSCGNYTNIDILFLLLAIIYILDTVLRTFSPSQFLISIKSLSQIAFSQHFAWKLHYKHTCYYFSFSFFSVVLGPLPLQSVLYLLRVYFFRFGFSKPSASCILLKIS